MTSEEKVQRLEQALRDIIEAIPRLSDRGPWQDTIRNIARKALEDTRTS